MSDIGSTIETLREQEQWPEMETAARDALVKDPKNHWLVTRLSDAIYEQKQYTAALEYADQALAIVPDCPLALWAKAGALDMLGRSQDALEHYVEIVKRGIQEIREPDEDAEECWEGQTWTFSLLTDCMFRIAGCLEDTGDIKGAAYRYKLFVSLLDAGNASSLYSREQAEARLKKLDENEANIELSKRLIESSFASFFNSQPIPA
jgi:tetratricopeptide (TPR) repeat protein